MAYDVFISYSRKDTAIADKICKTFDSVGITYFIDRQGIGGGFEFPEVLANAILDSKIVLYLASENSYKSKFTNSELTFAFNEKPKNSILPYIIDGSNMPTGLRFVFSSINWRTKETHPIETVLLKDILLLLGKSEAEIKTLFQNIVKDEELERKHKAEEQKRKEAERIRIEEERKKEEARKLKEELRYVKKQEENSTQSYNVTLENAGANKLAVVKVVKECMGIGLVEAKFIVDNTPIIITEKALKNEAVMLKRAIEEAGAVVTIKLTQSSMMHNGHEYVDLGLPSGLKWATCNVGAIKPQEYGDYFAWGETTPKQSYVESNYKWYKKSFFGGAYKLTKYKDERESLLEYTDDAARVNWGGKWRMPTRTEQDELRNHCTWEWTTLNGEKGYKVISKKNGNSIFLPAAGRRCNNLFKAGSDGDYWSSSLNTSNSSYAYDLTFYSGSVDRNYNSRYLGRSVRAVCECA